MTILKTIDRYLLHRWEWSKDQSEEQFWLDCSREFLFAARTMKKKSRDFEDSPLLNSFFELVKTFDFK